MVQHTLCLIYGVLDDSNNIDENRYVTYQTTHTHTHTHTHTTDRTTHRQTDQTRTTT